MGMGCGISMVKYILFVFNLICAVSQLLIFFFNWLQYDGGSLFGEWQCKYSTYVFGMSGRIFCRNHRTSKTALISNFVIVINIHTHNKSHSLGKILLYCSHFQYTMAYTFFIVNSDRPANTQIKRNDDVSWCVCVCLSIDMCKFVTGYIYLRRYHIFSINIEKGHLFHRDYI